MLVLVMRQENGIGRDANPIRELWKCPYCKRPFCERKDAESHIRERHAKQVNGGYDDNRGRHVRDSGRSNGILFDTDEEEDLN